MVSSSQILLSALYFQILSALYFRHSQKQSDSQPCNSLFPVVKILTMIIAVKPPTFPPLYATSSKSQCKPQCHYESLTLARRVLKKSFQIPLTGVTAILWVWEWGWAAEHLPLCQSVPPALQVLSTFPPEYKMQRKSVKRRNNNIQQYSTYLIAKTKNILLLILDQIQLKQEYKIKWTFRMVLIYRVSSYYI